MGGGSSRCECARAGHSDQHVAGDSRHPGAASGFDAQQKEAKQHRLTDEALAQVQAQERLLGQRLYAAEMSLAFEALERGHFGGARELLIKQQKKETAHLRGWEWRHIKILSVAVRFIRNGNRLVPSRRSGSLVGPLEFTSRAAQSSK